MNPWLITFIVILAGCGLLYLTNRLAHYVYKKDKQERLIKKEDK